MFTAKDEPKHLERLTNRVDVIADRLDTLATTISTTAAAIAKKDGELANLRRELEDGSQRVESLAAAVGDGAGTEAEIRELRRAVTSLAAERSEPAGDKRVRELDARVALLSNRVEALATTVSTTASGLAGRNGELAAIKRSLAAARPADGQVAVDEALRRRIQDLASSAATAIVRLQTQADELAGLRADMDARIAGIAGDVTALSGRLDLLTAEVATSASGLRESEHELDALRRELTEAGSRVAAVADGLQTVLGAISEAAEDDAARSEAVERLEQRVDEAVARQQTVTARLSGELEHALTGMSARIDEVERNGSAVVSELARAKALWPSALRSLEARVDDLRRQRRESDAAPGEDARSPVTGSNGSAEPFGAAAVESTRAHDPPAASGEPSGTDGRVVAEVRSLERRLERAEASARDGREALLMQLERLAARLEWRLQRLEAGSEDVVHESTPTRSADVVHLQVSDP